MPVRVRAQPRSCRLCGLSFERVGVILVRRAVCNGCLERLEWELALETGRACPSCGRHPELCAVEPCHT
jgi:hypothetical protein